MRWLKNLLKQAALLFLLLFSFASWGSVSDFTRQIVELSKCVPLSVTSWIRTPHRNDTVGGVANSQHLEGLAVDIVLDHEEDRPLLLRKLHELGYYVLQEEDHIHVGYYDDTTRNYNNVRISCSRGDDESLRAEAREREDKTSAVHGEGWGGEEGTDRGTRDQGQEVHVDTQSDRIIGSVCSINPSEISGYLGRYWRGVWMDGVQSRLPVLHGGERSTVVENNSREYYSDNSSGHSHSFSNHRTVLRWVDSFTPIRRFSFTGAWG